MKINLAIYTATEGFDWQPGSVYSRVELNKYKEMIGRFPDILMEDVPYGGIFVCEGRLVFYRFHKAQRWDSRGRDALYCVLGTIPLDAGKKINLSRVFETQEFSSPMRPFPVSVEIAESLPIRPPSTWEKLQEGLNAASSAAQVGVYATFFGHGKFFCRLDGNGEKPTLKLTYEKCDLKPAPKVAPQPEPVTSPKSPSVSCDVAAVQAQSERSRAEMEKRFLAQELARRRIQSENQNLKNIIAILCGIIVFAFVFGIGAFVFRCCFSEPKAESISGSLSGVEFAQAEAVATKVLSDDKMGEDRIIGRKPSEGASVNSIEDVEGKPIYDKRAIKPESSAHPKNAGGCGKNIMAPEKPVKQQTEEKKGPSIPEHSPQPKMDDVVHEANERILSTGGPKVNGESYGGTRQATVPFDVGECEGSDGNVTGKDQTIICQDCKGAGRIIERVRCSDCSGYRVIALCCRRCGKKGVVVTNEHGSSFGICQPCRIYCEVKSCDRCGPGGRIERTSSCEACGGTGRIPKAIEKYTK